MYRYFNYLSMTNFGRFVFRLTLYKLKGSNICLAINGRSYGNLEGLSTCKFDTVSWHVLSFGDTEDLHGVKFNGNNLLINGVYTDSHVSISGLTFTGIMHAQNEG